MEGVREKISSAVRLEWMIPAIEQGGSRGRTGLSKAEMSGKKQDNGVWSAGKRSKLEIYTWTSSAYRELLKSWTWVRPHSRSASVRTEMVRVRNLGKMPGSEGQAENRVWEGNWKCSWENTYFVQFGSAQRREARAVTTAEVMTKTGTPR